MADSMSGAGTAAATIAAGYRPAVTSAMTSAKLPDRLIAVRRVLTWVVIAQVAVLAVTGLYLAVAYHPSPAESWGVLNAEETGLTGREFAHSVRRAHRWTAWSAVLPAVVLAAVSLSEAMVRWRGPSRRRSGVVTGPVTAVLVLAGIATGLALPWEQLALKAVTVGTEHRGFGWLLGDDVRFVLIDGLEVSLTTMRAVFAAHVLAVPAVMALALGFSARRT